MTHDSAAERAALESRQVERVYSALAGVYDAAFDWALGPGRRRAVGRLGIRPGDHVLEVGVGTGLSLPHYPPEARITGVDISEPMIDRGRERADRLSRATVEFRLMDARDLAFRDATFDRVLAPYVISVVPEPQRVMTEIRRVCRVGGTIVVVNHFGSSNPLLGLAERALTPASRWIGFRMDLPLATVLETSGLAVRSIERVNLLGLWQLIVLEREH